MKMITIKGESTDLFAALDDFVEFVTLRLELVLKNEEMRITVEKKIKTENSVKDYNTVLQLLTTIYKCTF